MSTFRRTAAALAGLVLAVGLAACGSNNPADSGSSAPSASGTTYVVYSDNAFPPFEFLDTASNTYVGVDMDLLAAIAADQGFLYQVKNEGFDAAMGAVQSGQADAMIAGMTITDKRKATFDFSDGYFTDGQIMVVPQASAAATPADLKGTTVAVKASTQGATYANSVKDQFGFQVQVYEDSPTMYQAVVNGINSACFEDRSVIGWAIEQGQVKLKTVGDVLNPGEYGFAVKKGTHAELITKFNAGLANLKANGEYTKILAKYGY